MEPLMERRGLRSDSGISSAVETRKAPGARWGASGSASPSLMSLKRTVTAEARWGLAGCGCPCATAPLRRMIADWYDAWGRAAQPSLGGDGSGKPDGAAGDSSSGGDVGTTAVATAGTIAGMLMLIRGRSSHRGSNRGLPSSRGVPTGVLSAEPPLLKDERTEPRLEARASTEPASEMRPVFASESRVLVSVRSR